MHDVFIGRQPIYNRRLEVVAYELLFRSSDANHAAILDGDEATSQVIRNTFNEFGLDRIVGKHLAFINLTRSFLLGTYPLPVFKDRIVLEVLEDIVVDEDIVRAVHRLAEDGFTIALDDFIYHRDLQPLVDVARYIKMDILAMDRDTVRSHVELLRRHDVKLLAEKVESAEDFEFCQALGFDYFQGYFFCRPNVIRGRRPPTTRLAVLERLAQVQDPDTGAVELEALISQDTAMSRRLLRCLHSAPMGMATAAVDSIAQAIAQLGLDRVRALASLVVLSQIADKPRTLFITALVRARMCEQLAGGLSGTGQACAALSPGATCFAVGLFSVLDAMLDAPLDELLSAIALPEAAHRALLDYAGPVGEVLRCVVAYDVGDWDEVRCPADIATVREAYLAAVSWAEEIGEALDN